MQFSSSLSLITATALKAFFEKIKDITGEQKIEIEDSKHHGVFKKDYRASEHGDIKESIKRANIKRVAKAEETGLATAETTDKLNEEADHAYNIGLHETNLYSVFSALLLTEGYLLPGNKQRKLFAGPQTGESKGTTSLNKRYVSTHYLRYFPHNSIGEYLGYSAAAFRASYTSFNATVLQGKGTQVDQELYEKLSTIPASVIGEGASLQYVNSDFQEAGFKAVKILTIGVEEENIEELKRILSELGMEAIHIVSNTEIKKICSETDKFSFLKEISASIRIDLKALLNNPAIENNPVMKKICVSELGYDIEDARGIFIGKLKQLKPLLPANYIKEKFTAQLEPENIALITRVDIEEETKLKAQAFKTLIDNKCGRPLKEEGLRTKIIQFLIEEEGVSANTKIWECNVEVAPLKMALQGYVDLAFEEPSINLEILHCLLANGAGEDLIEAIKEEYEGLDQVPELFALYNIAKEEADQNGKELTKEDGEKIAKLYLLCYKEGLNADCLNGYKKNWVLDNLKRPLGAQYLSADTDAPKTYVEQPLLLSLKDPSAVKK